MTFLNKMQHCFSIHLITQRNAMFEKIIKLFQHQLCVTRLPYQPQRTNHYVVFKSKNGQRNS